MIEILAADGRIDDGSGCPLDALIGQTIAEGGGGSGFNIGILIDALGHARRSDGYGQGFQGAGGSEVLEGGAEVALVVDQAEGGLGDDGGKGGAGHGSARAGEGSAADGADAAAEGGVRNVLGGGVDVSRLGRVADFVGGDFADDASGGGP